MDLSNPKYYINRELSWLEFDERVLEEAQDKTNKILERFKFLAISANNLDEFFMVRVSGLMDQVAAGYTKKDPSDLAPYEQLNLISKKVHEIYTKQYNCLTRSLFPTLEKEKIFLLKYNEATKEQKEFLTEYFDTTIFPILTPMAVDQSRPFPVLNNKALNLILEIDDPQTPEEEHLFAFTQIPTVIPRIIKLPTSKRGKLEFILLEDLVKENISSLFEGYRVVNKSCFRITRNSDLEIDEDESEDLLKEIEDSIRKRRLGYPVRLEIEKNISKSSRIFLKKSFSLNEDDIYEVNGAIDLTVFFAISGIRDYPELRDANYTPVPSLDFYNKDIFEAIKEKDILVHHPYESFDSVVNFVKTAASDPNVLAIKQTLYRVSGNSPVVNALIKAAENGKQVTVLVELKARFDEENNIVWAKKLEKAGCHVIYGLVGLKTHCKICFVVRKEPDGIKRYLHLGTGNYNDSTAKIYTDLGYFTCKELYGQDISTLFNLLTGYSQNYNWKKISVAPVTLRDTFVRYIQNEAKNAKEGKKALIVAKMNSLVDVSIIQELYRASIAGVEIHLIVRGICCLRPKISKISENISTYSIVDRYLEHSRIYYFENNENPKIFLSSADWMPRNLDRRVEVAFPIESEAAKKEIMEILKITLSDTVKLRMGQSNGNYTRVDKRGKAYIESQRIFEKRALEKFEKYTKQDKEEIFTPI